jgi:hypothetical protein
VLAGHDAMVGMPLPMQALKMTAIVRQYNSTQAVSSLKNGKIISALTTILLSREHNVIQSPQFNDDWQLKIFVGIEVHGR